jgi:hypothetical protein
MKLIYMEPTLAMMAAQNPAAVEALVQSGTVKAVDNIPYLVIEVVEEEPKKTRRNTNKNKQ